jgi:hypothetical protein
MKRARKQIAAETGTAMTAQELFNEIQQVFQTTFEDPSLQISRTTTADDVDG